MGTAPPAVVVVVGVEDRVEELAANVPVLLAELGVLGLDLGLITGGFVDVDVGVDEDDSGDGVLLGDALLIGGAAEDVVGLWVGGPGAEVVSWMTGRSDVEVVSTTTDEDVLSGTLTGAMEEVSGTAVLAGGAGVLLRVVELLTEDVTTGKVAVLGDIPMLLVGGGPNVAVESGLMF